MGKRILTQKRGKGGSQWRARTRGKVQDARYPYAPPSEKLTGTITALVHERGRATPLAQITFPRGRISYLPAVSGTEVGSVIEFGSGATLKLGNVMPLSVIPEGTLICNIEQNYGDGGKLVKSAGGSAVLFSHSPSGSVVRMPSGRSVTISEAARATVGQIASSGIYEKPLLKAGAKYHLSKAKNRLFPRVRGIAMAAVHHPFGGGRHQHPGKSTSTSRNAPPGRKVGHIAPRKTGRKKIARKW